jgi:hypothetical protein
MGCGEIQSLLYERDANRILVVPLVYLVEEDKIIWNEESDDLYSVRYRYRKLMMIRMGDRGPWGILWKIQVPPKAKHMLWQICKQCLPIRVRLKSRFVQCLEKCPLCLEEPEEEWHSLFQCEEIK